MRSELPVEFASALLFEFVLAAGQLLEQAPELANPIDDSAEAVGGGEDARPAGGDQPRGCDHGGEQRQAAIAFRHCISPPARETIAALRDKHVAQSFAPRDGRSSEPIRTIRSAG